MLQRLSMTELVTAILLLAALTWAAVRIGPIAIERWFCEEDGDTWKGSGCGAARVGARAADSDGAAARRGLKMSV